MYDRKMLGGKGRRCVEMDVVVVVVGQAFFYFSKVRKEIEEARKDV